MKWYVRSEDGEVWGPMPEGEAESMRDQMSSALDDAVMFDERIFSPQFVTTPEVEELLRQMKSVCYDSGIVNPHMIREVMKRAIDTITLLSREKTEIKVPEDMDKLLAEIASAKLLVSKSCETTRQSAAILHFCDEGKMAELLQQTIDMIVHFYREKTKVESQLPEVENLVIDLQDMGRSREYPHCRELVQRAIDTITLLSRDQREKYRDGIRAAAEFAGTYDQQIAGIRHKFEDVILGKFNLVPREEMRDKEKSGKTFVVDKETTALVTGLLEINRDSQMRKEQVELCEAAAKMLVRLRIPKIVTGTIQGGVLTLEEVSEGVEVDIRDYDTDGVDEEMLTEDEAGTHFQGAG